MIVDLLSQSLPVKLHEGVLLGDFAYHSLRNPGAITESSQMQLLHFSAAAHIVHQIKRVSFSADKSHGLYLATLSISVVYLTSTTGFNNRFIQSREIASKQLCPSFAETGSGE